MKQNIVETAIGFLVLIITFTFLVFAYTNSGTSWKKSGGYIIKANFQSAEGISKGSDVMISGIKIGSVRNVTLDKDSFAANITLDINNDIKLPKDSKASIVTSGLLGGKYISVSPGSADENLGANGQIIYTQSALNLESLLSKILYSFGNK